MKAAWPSLLCLCAWLATAEAAPDDRLRDMDTDRPNITNTPHTIDAGHWQLEAGLLDYSTSRDAGGGDRTTDLGFGQFNLRVGVLSALEANVAIETYVSERTVPPSGPGTPRLSGPGDITIGGKLNLWGNDGGDEPGRTAAAIQPQFKLPTARRGLGNGRFEFAVGFPLLANLPAGYHLSLQPGIARERNSANTGYVAGFPSAVAIDREVLGHLDVYLEYACDPTTERHTTMAQSFDFGGTYPLTKNLMLDAGVNVGLNRGERAVEFVTGISIRR